MLGRDDVGSGGGKGLEVGELEADPTDEEVGEGERGDEGKDLDGVLEGEGAEDVGAGEYGSGVCG